MFVLFLSLFFANVLVVSEGPAQPQDLTQPGASETSTEQVSDEGVGTVVELKGSAAAVTAQGVRRTLQNGDAIYLNETLETAQGASMQVELNDESLFSLSEKTSVKVNDFAYDDSAKDGALATSVAKGVFRFISGKIAKVKPEKVNIEVPSGTIGIRGTIVVGEIEGEKCVIGLEAEEGDSSRHRIVVFNDAGGDKKEVEITQPGFATTISARGQAPAPVFQMPAEQQNRFQQAIPQRPQFAPGTQPGDPKRYAQLFDTSSMQERRQAQAREMRAQREEGMNQNLKDRQEQDPRRRAQSDQTQKGFNGPNGPGGGSGNGEDLVQGLNQRSQGQGFFPSRQTDDSRPRPFSQESQSSDSFGSRRVGKAPETSNDFPVSANRAEPSALFGSKSGIFDRKPPTDQAAVPENTAANPPDLNRSGFSRPSFGQPFNLGPSGGGSAPQASEVLGGKSNNPPPGGGAKPASGPAAGAPAPRRR